MTTRPDQYFNLYSGKALPGHTIGNVPQTGFQKFFNHPEQAQFNTETGAIAPNTTQGGELNLGNIGSAIGGAGSLLDIINGIRQTNLAKQQLNFNKQAYFGNVERQTSDYNRNLEDVSRKRQISTGQDPSKARSTDYFSRNVL